MATFFVQFSHYIDLFNFISEPVTAAQTCFETGWSNNPAFVIAKLIFQFMFRYSVFTHYLEKHRLQIMYTFTVLCERCIWSLA
jgi:hypothetical protein